MSTITAAAGKIDQVFAARSGDRPEPSHQSTVIPPNRQLYVRGWAVAPPQYTIEFRVDDALRVGCEQHLARPDIALAIGEPDARDCGIETFLDLPRLDEGTHELRLVAVEDERSETLDVALVVVSDPRPEAALRPTFGGQLTIDRIRVGARSVERDARILVAAPDEVIAIEGWAINAVGLREGFAMYAVIDDRYVLPVSYGRERADLIEALGSPSVRWSGFRAVIDPAPYASGTHLVRMVIVMDDGTAFGCDDTLALCVQRSPR